MIGFWVFIGMVAIFVSTCIIISLIEQSKENKRIEKQISVSNNEQIEITKEEWNKINNLPDADL